jgi:hypothetical protein
MIVVRILAFLVFLPAFAYSQVGNEWINFGQTYYKIPVGKDGLYKLTKSDLAQAGFPVGNDPRRYQLFAKGVEQAMIVSGQSDAVFNNTDYIEFYGKKNDGSLDAELYKPITAQPHSYHNLFNDTAYYFLTYNPTTQGKRMGNFTQANTGALAKQPYQQHEQVQVLSSSYSGGESFNNFVQYTSFGVGEGWSGPVIRENNSSDLLITSLTGGVPTAGLPSLELQVLGRGQVGHKAEIYVGPSASSLRLLRTVEFFGLEPFTFTDNLAWADISAAGNLAVRVNVVGTGGNDFISLSYARVQLPQNFSMSGVNEKTLSFSENPIGKLYVEIENAPAGARIFDITDSDNLIQIGSTQTSTLNFVVDDTDGQRPLRLFITTQTNTPTGIKRVTFRSLASDNANYVIVSHKALLKPAVGSANPVRDYAAYRASAAGGAFDTLSVTIDQLYNQFTYGESTPLAMFRFLKFLEAQQRPDYLLLIGKGLDASKNYYRNPTAPAFAVNKDFVPSAGHPASDMYYSAGLGGPENVPAIATGRLSVTSPEEVVYYLNKVKTAEATPYNDLWRKRILHLSGGIAVGEPETFRGYMEGFASIAEEEYLGASVASIAKRSLDAQELINISDQVNEGLNLITFFGHSSSSTTDFDIGFATNPELGYKNIGKYPMLLINGCNAGSFFDTNKLFGEDWINADQRGAVGFIAHSSFGFPSNLKLYSEFLYRVAYGDSTFMKRGIGDVQKEVAKQYLEQTFGSAQHITQVQQMILLGDPAVKLFGADKTDFALNNTSVAAMLPDGKTITTSTPSFDLRIVVKNFGRAEPTPLTISVKRTFPDNTSITYDSTVAPIYHSDTVFFAIPNTGVMAGGTHQFEIQVDAPAVFDELSETNNSAVYSLFIPRNGTKNLYPTDYALVNTINPVLTFQSANLLDSLRSLEVEIDTANTFDSDYKQGFTLEAEVLAKAPVAILSTDSTTYYWRTRLKNPSPDENAGWEQSSFTYILNSTEGWGQLDFPQFYQNQLNALVIDQGLQEIAFTEAITPVLIKTFGDTNTTLFTEVSVKIDGSEYNLATQGQPCRDNTINLLAFNKISTVPYAGIAFNFQDPRTCGREPQVIVSFTATELYNNGTLDIIQYVDNIAIGDSVVLFTIGNASFSLWNAAAIAKLSEIGISVAQLSSLEDGEPVVIYGKKGSAAGTALVFVSDNTPAPAQELTVNKSITGKSGSGTMHSTRIGPALHWKEIKYRTLNNANDQVAINVYGIGTDGSESELLAAVPNTTDLSSINASQYPYLRLRYSITDDVDLTVAQLPYWIVEHEPLPEGIASYKGFTTTAQSTEDAIVKEGEAILFEFGFTNVSSVAFGDSLVVEFRLVNETTNTTELIYDTIKAPIPGDTTLFLLQVSTLNKVGVNNVTVTVNPAGLVSELFLDNNVLVLNNAFEVTADIFSPSLSVTVDGRLVQNGDFVSPSPDIEIKIWDENELVLKTDTLGVLVLLQRLCETCVQQTIYFSRNDVQWFPATTTSPFSVLFSPQNLEDGIYELQVSAADSRGNKSGTEPYVVAFEVRNENSITISPPYPNPSGGQLTFEVVITGSDVPPTALFELVNTTGKLMHTHMISTTWHTGINYLSTTLPEQLPSGLYIYRLVLANGKEERGQFVINR